MLELSHICHAYGKNQVLSDASLKLSAGELVGIIGKNGSGKTTLLRVAAGLLLPTAGTRTLNGTPYAALPRRDFAKEVAYFPQTRPLPALTVWEYVALARYPHKSPLSPLGEADRRAIAAALDKTDTARFADRPLAALSGGERQRVYLALLLAQGASTLLLDEPVAHLDAAQAFALAATLRHLADDGSAVCAVLHDLALALSVCDRLLLFDGGRAVADLPPAALIKSGLIERVLGVRALPTENGFAVLPL